MLFTDLRAGSVAVKHLLNLLFYSQLYLVLIKTYLFIRLLLYSNVLWILFSLAFSSLVFSANVFLMQNAFLL